jgi:hypothetical protein
LAPGFSLVFEPEIWKRRNPSGCSRCSPFRRNGERRSDAVEHASPAQPVRLRRGSAAVRSQGLPCHWRLRDCALPRPHRRPPWAGGSTLEGPSLTQGSPLVSWREGLISPPASGPGGDLYDLMITNALRKLGDSKHDAPRRSEMLFARPQHAVLHERSSLQRLGRLRRVADLATIGLVCRWRQQPMRLL